MIRHYKCRNCGTIQYRESSEQCLGFTPECYVENCRGDLDSYTIPEIPAPNGGLIMSKWYKCTNCNKIQIRHNNGPYSIEGLPLCFTHDCSGSLEEYFDHGPAGILTKSEIIKQVELGNIVVDPFDLSMLGPNSIDVRLGPDLIQLDSDGIRPWDLTEEIPIEHQHGLRIPDTGIILQRGVAYLGHTVEKIHCKNYVPWLDGRSTVGRYFLQCHMTAGRGDLGWSGTFTLELMSMARNVRVYADLPIAQVTFFSVQGEIIPYCGRYNSQTGPKLPVPLKR